MFSFCALFQDILAHEVGEDLLNGSLGHGEFFLDFDAPSWALFYEVDDLCASSVSPDGLSVFALAPFVSGFI